VPGFVVYRFVFKREMRFNPIVGQARAALSGNYTGLRKVCKKFLFFVEI
jgi:hypothetical protein